MKIKNYIIPVLLIVFSVCMASAQAEETKKSKKKKPPPKIEVIDTASLEVLRITDENVGMLVEENVDKKPKSGTLSMHRIVLPKFEKGIYYRPYSTGLTGNRIAGIAFSSINDLVNFKTTSTNKGHTNLADGQYMVLKVGANKYLSLMPMLSSQAISYFQLAEEELLLKTGSFGSELVKGDIPLIIWAYGKSPYEAVHLAWKRAMESNYLAGNWRYKKEYPEIYEYLGWCSWEHYRTEINEENMVEAIRKLESSGAPFRWVIIDDGYLTHDKKQLIEFSPDAEKFPNGWAPLISLKNPEKIKWMGIWRNFLGYMGGVSPKHQMDDIRQYLVQSKRPNIILPDGSPEAATAFFEAMTLDSKNNGFDFTKVDFQAKAFKFYNKMPNAVRAMRANNEALEVACKNHNLPLLNCIAQTHVNSYNFRYSALLRVGRDYSKTNKNNNKCITYQSFANNLWTGQTVWGDFDMFHSHAEDANIMALARAISGGSVYVSDEPSQIVPDVLKKLCLEDGKLLRAQAPATLLPESFFIHPFREKKPVRVVAPLANNVAAIGFFNLTEKNAVVEGFVSAADYPFAGEQLQPYRGPWAQPEGGLLMYDPDAVTAKPLADSEKYTIPNYQGKLVQLHPITNGWAVIGRTDKYLPAAAVEKVSSTANKLTFTLLEAGPFAVWSESGIPKMDGVSFTDKGNGLFVADLKIGDKNKSCVVTR